MILQWYSTATPSTYSFDFEISAKASPPHTSLLLLRCKRWWIYIKSPDAMMLLPIVFLFATWAIEAFARCSASKWNRIRWKSERSAVSLCLHRCAIYFDYAYVYLDVAYGNSCLVLVIVCTFTFALSFHSMWLCKIGGVYIANEKFVSGE